MLSWAKLRIVTVVLSVPTSGLAGSVPLPCHVADACYLQCESTRECQLQQDTRDCRSMFAFGTAANDPICEASKAAQNQIYAIQKAQCEGNKSGEKSQCEAQKAACRSVANACTSTRGNA